MRSGRALDAFSGDGSGYAQAKFQAHVAQLASHIAAGQVTLPGRYSADEIAALSVDVAYAIVEEVDRVEREREQLAESERTKRRRHAAV